MDIFFTIDGNSRIYPCCDNTGQEPENGWLSGNIDGPAFNRHGIPLWKYDGEKCTKRTDAEIQSDITDLPFEEPNEAEQLRADLDFLTMENEALESESEHARADIDYLLMITEEE